MQAANSFIFQRSISTRLDTTEITHWVTHFGEAAGAFPKTDQCQY